MACLPTITGSQLLACGRPPFAPLGRPVSAKLIRADHVESYTVSSTPYLQTAVVTLASAAVVTNIEASNGALVVSMGVKGGEVYPQAYDPTIELTFFGDFGSPISSSLGAAIRGGANISCAIAVDHGNGAYRIYGLGYPLECLSIEGDTNGNGYTRVTYGVEEWQAGTTIYAMTEADYNALSTGGGSTGGGVVDPNPLG